MAPPMVAFVLCSLMFYLLLCGFLFFATILTSLSPKRNSLKPAVCRYFSLVFNDPGNLTKTKFAGDTNVSSCVCVNHCPKY